MNNFKVLSEEDVAKVVKSLKSKSCELDTIRSDILKKELDTFLPIITKLVNLSLQQGVFSSDWKCAIVRPLLKKIGLELIDKNYRPVSNLSFLSKVVEKCALNQYKDHCNQNEMIPAYQSAYREDYSCETALVKLFNDTLWNFESQKVSMLVAIDLSAAFDTVDHQILLDLLNTSFGIGGKCLNWFDTYLRPRSFKVCVGSANSQEKELEYSVPQGSVAGPYLYLTYASTLPEAIAEGISIFGFADDHAFLKAFIPIPREEGLVITYMEKSLRDTGSWMNSKRLKMNNDKTEFIYFGNKRQIAKCKQSSIDANGTRVDRTDEMKYLGVWMDSELKLKHHITEKCRKAMASIQKLKAIRKYLTVEACKTVASGLVLSHIDYANAILFGLSQTELNKLQRIQSITAKLILGRQKHDSVTCALKELHWLPVQLRIKHKIITLVHKCIYGKAPQYLKELIKAKQIKRAGLRSGNISNLLEVPRCSRKTYASRSFSVAGPTLWNSLPEKLRGISDFDTFKHSLKTFLFSQF